MLPGAIAGPPAFAGSAGAGDAESTDDSGWSLHEREGVGFAVPPEDGGVGREVGRRIRQSVTPTGAAGASAPSTCGMIR